MILILSAILFSVFAIIILYLQYGLKAQVHIKDYFVRVEENDGKLNDILIVYSSKDSDIALGVLMETLEKRYNYKCTSRELPRNINMCKYFSNSLVFFYFQLCKSKFLFIMTIDTFSDFGKCSSVKSHK